MQGAKLQAARSTVSALLDAAPLAPDGDRAALVSFAATATVETSLTADRAGLAAALAGTGNRAGARLDKTIEVAVKEALNTSSRPRAGKAIVIVSDGGQTEKPDEALHAARWAESRGVRVLALAVGDGADLAWLTSVAGAPERAFDIDEHWEPEPLLAAIRRSVGGCP